MIARQQTIIRTQPTEYVSLATQLVQHVQDRRVPTVSPALDLDTYTEENASQVVGVGNMEPPAITPVSLALVPVRNALRLTSRQFALLVAQTSSLNQINV